MDGMLVSKGCSSTAVSTEPSFYPPSPLYPLWPCNPMRWMQIDWPITHTHLCCQGSPLNPWDSATCVSLYMYRHTASRQLPGSTCSTPHRTGKQKCESLLTLVTAFRCHNVPARLASRPPRRKLTGSTNTSENKPPSTLMSVCATYLQSKCNSDHFEAKVKGLIAGIRRA